MKKWPAILLLSLLMQSAANPALYFGTGQASLAGTVYGQDAFATVLKPTLVQHCIKCHGQQKKIEGKVNLHELTSSSDLAAKPALLRTMIKAVEDQEMPPYGEPPLKATTRAALVAHLKAVERKVAESQGFPPTPIRRLNRFQYNNAVVDLLDLKRDIFALPEKMIRRYSDYFQPQLGTMPASVRIQNRPLGKDVDSARAEGFSGVGPFPQDLRAEHGFDNRADHLTLSPLLMESFLKLSHSIVESRDLKPAEVLSWNRFFMLPPNLRNEANPTVEAQLKVIRTRLKPFCEDLFVHRSIRRHWIVSWFSLKNSFALGLLIRTP